MKTRCLKRVGGVCVVRRSGGVDLTPGLSGRPIATSDRPLLFHYPHVWGPRGHGYQPHSALRLGRWKVIYFYESGTWELYDLQDDVGESTNLADHNPGRLDELAGRLISLLRDRGALYPVDRGTGQPLPPAAPDSQRSNLDDED